MTPEQIEQIIDMLAERLGPMAQVVWEAYVTQAALTAVRTSVIAGFLIILTLFSAVLLGCFVWGSKYEKEDSGKSFCQGAAFFDAMAFVCVSLGAIWFAADAYMRVHNPAYYAIQMLLGK